MRCWGASSRCGGPNLALPSLGWAVYCSQGVPVVGVDGLRDSGYVRFQFHGGSGGQSSIDFVDKAAVPGVFHDGSVCLPAAHRSGEESAVVRGSGPSALVAQEEGFVNSDGPGVLRPGSYDGDHPVRWCTRRRGNRWTGCNPQYSMRCSFPVLLFS